LIDTRSMKTARRFAFFAGPWVAIFVVQPAGEISHENSIGDVNI